MEEAVINNDLETLKFLLEQGHDPNGTNIEGRPYIFLTDNREIITLLLDNGADPKKPDEYGFLLEDYANDIQLIETLKKERNSITIKPSKFNKYRETTKENKKKRRTIKSSAGHKLQSD